MSHPYIPNADPEIERSMLDTIGASTIDDLYHDIPESLRFRDSMDLPEPIHSEQALKRHVEELLDQNQSSRDLICFRGGGCAPHYVPAVCDEVNRRAEFLTAYAGEPYEDHGRFQALYEYASMMGELLDTDVVSIPTFDWNQAAATCLRMAQRINGRSQMFVSETISPERLSTIQNYCRSSMELVLVPCDPNSGLLDSDWLQKHISEQTIGLYFENPGYLGVLESRAAELAEMIHGVGGLVITGTDPIALGAMKPPSQCGADLTCGDLQPLGIHMQQGGGQSGFIASRDDERIIREYPSRLFSLTRTSVAGEWGFGDVLYDDRTSFGARENGKEFVGTGTALWAITAGVYLALMGPSGMAQIGQTILQHSHYARRKIAAIPGLSVRGGEQTCFKEFVVDCSASGMSAAMINQFLAKHGIIGGLDLTNQIPSYDQCMLFCVTEVHTVQDIDLLVSKLQTIIPSASSNINDLETCHS